ncbi:MAG: hypothetical protein QOH83_243 [Solirubrobacteraceae bacterium]|jgi:hypothetical protein|nr:hypothetical protein [Solirubrobacteraceae bacterium]
MAIATRPANNFKLSCNGTRITYSTTSFGGPPQLQYVSPEGTLNFSGDEIQTLQSALGTEVTVTLETQPDLHTITLTLLLPSIILDADLESEFETLAIKTTNHTTIAGPPVGPEQTYEADALHGVATAVDF